MSSPEHSFDEALRLHQAGRIAEAIELYNLFLPADKSDARLLYMLGLAHLQIGQLEKGVEQIERSILLNPDNAFAHYNLGTALRRLDRMDEALVSYDWAIALRPVFAEAYSNRGLVLEALNRLGDALASYKRAIALRPDDAKTYNNLGKALKALNRLDEALASLDHAIALKPDYAEAYSNRGTVLQEFNRLDEALASCDRAIALKPDFAQAYSNRGAVLQAFNRLDGALASYDQPIALDPGYAQAYSNRGTVLQAFNRLDEALASYNQAIALDPDYAEACSNRGAVLQAFNRLNEALASYDRAIALQPDYAEAHWNKSLLLILTGHYAAGWELYEWRLQKKDTKNKHYVLPQPAWRGQEQIAGKKLFIYSEQGLGDVIQFCRYLPKVQSLGADVIFEVPPSLVSFISSLDCRMNIVAKGAALPEFDAYCPVMSLPMAFKTTVDTIPAEVPYLFSDEITVERWSKRLGNRTKLRIGLVWSGYSKHKNDANRSIPLEILLPLTELPIELHSLQKDYRQHDLATLDRHPGIWRHEDDLDDFSDTAALIECLDMVISVDTSVAHVASAMG